MGVVGEDTLFEAHVTVDTEDVERWRWVCGVHGIKPLCIELSHGEHPRQVMCAAAMVGTYLDALNWFEALTQQIDDVFPVVRTKLECPLDKSQIFGNPAYHECHMKLMLPIGTGWENLRNACADACVHASRNLLLYGNDESVQKWYLTQRYYGGPHPHAAATTFNHAYRVVSEHHVPVRMEMECVVLDSNPGLDAGWCATIGENDQRSGPSSYISPGPW